MPKVLVAEDEPALREIFCDVLRTLGLECIPAADGTEAIELARKHLPEVIVSDYMMPGRSGMDVVRAVRADPVLERVPVILLSAGRPSENERKEAWRFLKKPIDLEVLETSVREALDAAATPVGFTAEPPGSVSPLSLVREEMLGWVSHEIKSPLSAAMTATQLLMRGVQNGDEAPAMQRRLTQIMRQLRRMDELVNSLLDAAQLQEGRLEIETERVDMVALVQSVVSYWRDSQTEVAFEVTQATADAVVEGDAERLRQILDNFVSNAIKYGGKLTSDREPILMGLRIDATHVVVTVTDHGRGIPREQVPHIFDRFHRVAGQGGRGHGLGLYIAAALARLHGGLVSVDSQVGRGSTFAVTLPLASAIAPAAAVAEE